MEGFRDMEEEVVVVNDVIEGNFWKLEAVAGVGLKGSSSLRS